MPSRRATPHPSPHEHPSARPVVYVLDRAAARRLDGLAASRFGMPSIVLMENASRAVAEVTLRVLDHAEDAKVMVVCGGGNNGGDGLGAARHLHNAGVSVAVLLAFPAEKAAGDAAVNLDIARRMNLSIFGGRGGDAAADAEACAGALGGPDLIIDALFGTGLDRPVEGRQAALIGWINARRKAGTLVLSVDLPSGLDCDSGEPLGAAVQADVTVTFAGLKAGFTSLRAQEYVGEIVIGDLGVPPELVAACGRPAPSVGHGEIDDAEPPERPGRKPGDSAT